MYRSLFSVAAAFSLLLSTIISPAEVYARRCPVEPPNTLLSLYRKSDAVYLGKFDKQTDGAVTRQGDDSSTVNVTDRFSISTTFKGESRKFFERSYDDYRYQGNTGNESEPEIDEEDYEGPRRLKVGDTVLLFLKFVEEDGESAAKEKLTLDVVHYRDGIKRLDVKDVSAYESRINDLKGLFSAGKPSDAAILQWILRCIEDPATRWEGAYELLDSFQNLDWKEQQEKEAVENPDAKNSDDDSDAVEDPDEQDSVVLTEEADEEEFDNSVFAKLLTTAQKDELTNIAIAGSSKKSDNRSTEEESEELSTGDRVLFEVVKRWGDAKIASAMLDRLRATGDNYDKLNWMSSIAEILNDKELSSISEKYGDVTYQEDDSEVELRKDAPEGSSVEESASVEDDAEVPAAPDEADGAKSESPDAASGDKPVKRTYKMLRDELTSKFIERAGLLLTAAEKKAEAK